MALDFSKLIEDSTQTEIQPIKAIQTQANEVNMHEAEAGRKTAKNSNKQHARFFREAFDYLEAHRPVSYESAFWEKAYVDLNTIANKYNNAPFLNALLLTVYDELEREMIEQGNEQGNPI